MSVHRMHKVLADLELMPMTMRELLEVNDIKQPSMSSTLKALKERQLVRIIEWRRSERQGPFIPVYGLGSGEDAQKPFPVTSRMRNRKYWRANKAAISIRRSKEKSSLASWIAPLHTALRQGSAHGK